MSRPEKEINWSVFEKLCGIMCTETEICSVLGVSEDTLARRVKKQYGENYTEVYKKYTDTGKMSLRRTLFRQAESKPAVAIFLAKNYLGMKDNPDTTDYGQVFEAIRKMASEIEVIDAVDK